MQPAIPFGRKESRKRAIKQNEFFFIADVVVVMRNGEVIKCAI